MRHIFLIFQCLVFLNLSGCNCKPDVWNKEKISTILEMRMIDPPPLLLSRLTFITGKDSLVYETSFFNLMQFFFIEYKDSSVSINNFLYEVLNQRRTIDLDTIDKLDIFKVYKLDNEISNLFNIEKLNGLIIRYCIIKGSEYVLRNDVKLSKSQIATISYFFFKCGYIKGGDDYNAKTYYVHYLELVK